MLSLWQLVMVERRFKLELQSVNFEATTECYKLYTASMFMFTGQVITQKEGK